MIEGLTPRSRAHHLSPNARAPHFVYRCYDSDGNLLYIGCTVNVAKRIAAHRRGNGAPASRWLQVCMTRFEVEGPFEGRDAGRETERRAIQTEHPLFNYQDRAGVGLAAWMTRSPIAQYLVDRGHLELALETVCMCWPEDREEPPGYSDLCPAHVAQAALLERAA